MPQSKGGVDSIFEGQVTTQQTTHKSIWDDFNLPKLWAWNMPKKNEWEGDITDNVGIAKAFDRKQVNQDYVDAIKDATSSGVEYDLQRSAQQVDFLGQLERAFRARHLMRRTRAWCLAMGRIKANGMETGPITQLSLEYVRELDKRAKS